MANTWVGELFRLYNHDRVQEVLTRYPDRVRRVADPDNTIAVRVPGPAVGRLASFLWLRNAAHERGGCPSGPAQTSQSGGLPDPFRRTMRLGRSAHGRHTARDDRGLRSNASAPRVRRSRPSFVGDLLLEAKADPHCRHATRTPAETPRSEAKNCAGLAPTNTRSASINKKCVAADHVCKLHFACHHDHRHPVLG